MTDKQWQEWKREWNELFWSSKTMQWLKNCTFTEVK